MELGGQSHSIARCQYSLAFIGVRKSHLTHGVTNQIASGSRGSLMTSYSSNLRSLFLLRLPLPDVRG